MSPFNNLKMKMPVLLSLVLLLSGGILLSGCTQASQGLRLEKAKRIYFAANLTRNDINTEHFPLAAFERVHNDGGEAVIYIDGQPRGFFEHAETPYAPDNPTPREFTALKMAAADKGDNVIYLGAPCAYLTQDSLSKCDPRYLSSHQFSDDVIESYSQVLTKYRKRHDLKGIHLVGHSGGGAIAALLAKKHPKVLSLRTVAGVLDTDLITKLTGKPSFRENLNPAEDAFTLGVLPQHHFIGGKDELVPPAVLNSFVQAVGPSRCVRTTLVPDAEHRDGWAEKWPALLESPLDCKARSLVPDMVMEEEYVADPVSRQDAMPPLSMDDIETETVEEEKPLSPESARFLVFFDLDSSDIPDSAENTLDRTAEEVKTNDRLDTMIITGHADTTGSKEYNEKLGLRRAKAVKEAFEKRGISPDMMSVKSEGEMSLLVPTEDNVKEPENRRVEIEFE